GYNFDEGLYADAGFKYVHQGFRKDPGSSQQVILGRALGARSTRFSYTGDWVNAIDKADAEIAIKAYFPNVINFFGLGNQTPFNKTGEYLDYYRARFGYYTADATLRFQNLAGTTSLRIGPSMQYYHSITNNDPHLTDNASLVHSYDSTSINKNKMHVGLIVTYINDKRNNKILTDWGVYVNVRMQAYAGLGNSARTFFQAIPEAILYKSVDTKSNFVISERLGGGITFGQTAFYQSMFLGGQDNLTGFKQNRFAGQQMLYNNIEARIKLSDFFPYITPGQFGFTAAYDIGRVWVKGETSNEWHHGFGGGMYFSPSDMALFKIKGGYSKEGFYPYINFSVTF
ncbi:MAG: BamA/TamA family outer membrane protein, partial [Mucilaginibacter sp.]|nr:BamA/TamA family outer membrane protein [Mucilaginibacter sp.]